VSLCNVTARRHLAEAEWVALWRRAVGGDRPARDELIEAAYPVVYAAARKATTVAARLASGSDARDFALEAVAYILPRLGGFDPARGPFLGWVVMMVRSACWRARGCPRAGEPVGRSRSLPTCADERTLDRADPRQDDPAAVPFAPELWAFVDRLPADERDAVRWHFADGLNYADVGRRAGVSRIAGRDRVRRGLDALRLMMGAAEGGPRYAARRSILPAPANAGQ
jgi:RNA polymerase sigma factor (sigma-70 family)